MYLMKGSARNRNPERLSGMARCRLTCIAHSPGKPERAVVAELAKGRAELTLSTRILANSATARAQCRSKVGLGLRVRGGAWLR